MSVTTPHRPAGHHLGTGLATGQAAQMPREARPWVERLGRFGIATKGLVYLLIGGLAAMAAFGAGGMTTDQQGIFAWLLEQPLGRPLLWLVTIGLFGYALWRLVQAGLDTEDKGTDASGLAMRAGYAVSGLLYAGLGVSAARLAMGGAGGAGGTQSTQDWTAWLMSQPFGAWLVGLVGAAVVGRGLFELYRAYSAKFREKLRLDELSGNQEELVTRLGRAGFSARGIAFLIIGGFLMVAAIQAEPREARGLSGVFDTLAAQPFGPWLLGLVALGLACYGLYMLVEARYRRIRVE